MGRLVVIETVGQRLYLIRLACGDGRRKPESGKKFSQRVKRATGTHYDPSAISLLERMRQQWKLSDIDAFAAVDPEERGVVWLSTFADAGPEARMQIAAHEEPAPELQPTKKATGGAKKGGRRRRAS